jgi:hypothetical protein
VSAQNAEYDSTITGAAAVELHIRDISLAVHQHKFN